MVNNETFMIFNVSEIDKINFNQVEETDINTIRKSVNQSKAFVKWTGSIPSSVQSLTTKEGPYTFDEMTSILSTNEWSNSLGPRGYCS